MTEGTKLYNITYGVDDQRRRTEFTSNDTTQTRYYLGDYEEESDNEGNVKKIHYLSGGAMLIQNNGVETLYYGYADNQGSLIALTDKDGTAVEKYAYDPWGACRNPADWQLKDTRKSFITNRGYTGHEHMDAFNIINMNGRVYDPVTAMFFSPDPFIQSPENWMNYNRYSYVMNNPTRFTDPTGYNPSGRDSDQASGYDWTWGEDAGGSAGGGGGSIPGNRGVYSRGSSSAYNIGSTHYVLENNSYVYKGDVVTFEDVYNNYIIPNGLGYSMSKTNSGNGGIYTGTNSNNFETFRGLSFNNDKLGLTQWYKENGYDKLESIMLDYSGSNNAFNGVHDISSAGLKFIAFYEGYSATTYKDVAGLPTIGYGHLIKSGESFGILNRQVATQLLRNDAAFAVNAVNKYVNASLSQNQFDALISFTFNVGARALSKSSLLRNVNSENNLSIYNSFMMWNKATINEVLTPVQGLTDRRQAEANLFLNGNY